MSANTVQSSVSVNGRVGIPGMPFSADPTTYKTVTRIATVAIAFGSWVAFDGEFCFLASSSAGVAGREGGVAMRSNTFGSEGGYAAGDPVTVMTEGDIWVNCNAGMTAMDRVYVRISTGAGSGAIGEFASNATGAAYAPGVRIAANNSGAANGAAPTGSTRVRVLGVADGWPTGAAGA